MTCIELVMVAGAAYRPLLDMVPTSGGLSDQITPVLLAPVTVAVNCCVCPAISVPVGGDTVTLMDESVTTALEVLRSNPLGVDARLIGNVESENDGICELKTTIGGRRILQKPYGEQLPRIC